MDSRKLSLNACCSDHFSPLMALVILPKRGAVAGGSSRIPNLGLLNVMKNSARNSSTICSVNAVVFLKESELSARNRPGVLILVNPLPSSLLQAGDALRQSECLQHSGARFFYRERLMAGAAVLGDGQLLVGRGVRPIVAPKATGEIGVSQIVRVCAPSDF